MYNELIDALQCTRHFALYQDCYEKNCYANSGKGLYCNIPKLMADAADALEAADAKIVKLNTKCADLQSQINSMENEIEELMPKEGEWIMDGKYNRHCSRCNEDVVWSFNYCPNCGARMKGEDDEQIH